MKKKILHIGQMKSSGPPKNIKWLPPNLFPFWYDHVNLVWLFSVKTTSHTNMVFQQCGLVTVTWKVISNIWTTLTQMGTICDIYRHHVARVKYFSIYPRDIELYVRNNIPKSITFFLWNWGRLISLSTLWAYISSQTAVKMMKYDWFLFPLIAMSHAFLLMIIVLDKMSTIVSHNLLTRKRINKNIQVW